MSMPLAIKRSNSAGTTFKPKFVFLFRFSIDYYTETRTIPFETLQFVVPVSTIFKKIIAHWESCASPAYTSPLLVNYMGFSLSLKPVDQQQRQLTVRAYFRLGIGFKLTMNGLNHKKFSIQVVTDFR